MFSLKKLDHHFGLMEDVAKRVGVDFGEALAEGRISPETLRGAALRCTGCTHPEECADWAVEHAAGTDQAPVYCRNGLLMDRLRSE